MGLTREHLTTIATRTGCRVVAAWSGRNQGAMGEVYGVVMHHTGSAWGTAVAPTLKIVQEGRSDLQNALCTYYIDRAGTIYLITEKVAWHAGAGKWNGVTDGNGHLLGIEAESDGKNWTPATIESFVRLVAEICRFLGVDPNVWAIRHAQWAPTRKIDFSGHNEADFRKRVAGRLAGIPTATAPAAPVQEDDMPLTQAEVNWIADTIANRGLAPGLPAWQAWRDAALKTVDVGQLAAAIVAKLPEQTAAASAGVSKADIESAVRAVFADAGTA